MPNDNKMLIDRIKGVAATQSDSNDPHNPNVYDPIAEERERCAKIAENPGFIECRDTDWDLGVNYAKKFIADAIRRQR